MRNNKVKNYYDDVAVDYNLDHYINTNSYPTLIYRHNYILDMLTRIDITPDFRILDVGCGPGALIQDMTKYKCELVGIDIAEEMITIAKDKIGAETLAKNKILLDTGDIENLKFPDNHFDIIICSGIVEYLQDDKLWMQEIKRTLKDGGYLIINVTNRYAVRRWTMGLLNKVKRSKLVFSALNFFKEKVLRRGKLDYFPFTPRTHSPSGFDRLMQDNGMKKITHDYFDFSILPYPLDTFLGFVMLPARRSLEKHSKKNMVLSGTGYLAMYQFKK